MYVSRQWFSTFLMLRPFSTVLSVVVTPNHKSILLPLRNYNFCYCCESQCKFRNLLCDSPTPKGLRPTNWELLFQGERYLEKRPLPPKMLINSSIHLLFILWVTVIYTGSMKHTLNTYLGSQHLLHPSLPRRSSSQNMQTAVNQVA